MSRYIDAEKLIAKIERLVKVNKELKSSRFTEGIAAGYGDVLSAIASLQQEQPEVDLEKEYNTWWNSISGKINVEHIMEWYMHETASHFYELGRLSQTK